VDLHLVRKGSGPPLVLLPGTSSDWRVFAPVIDRLASDRDVLVVDLPGFGGSPELAADVTPDPPALARAGVDFVSGLGIERPHVAGNSLGAAVALEIGALGEAATVCALAPIGFWTDREADFCVTSIVNQRDLAERVPEVVRRTLLGFTPTRTLMLNQVFARPWRIPPDQAVALSETAKPGLDRVMDAYRRYRFTAADRIDCPVTVAWGTRDWLLIPREGRRVRRVLPRARMVWLEGLGHVSMWDDPDRVADLLLETSS